MNLRIAASKTEFENFVALQAPTSVLQSWHWYKVLEAEGRQAACAFVTEGDQVCASVLLQKNGLPGRFYYLYAPRGPIFASGLAQSKKEQIVSFLAKGARSLPGFNKALFLTLDPEVMANELDFTKIGFKKADKEIQPAHTQVLNIAKSQEDLLQSMKQKTRYNIRLAMKKDIEITTAASEQDVKEFYSLLSETAKRDAFSIHPYEHYRAIWQNLQPNNAYLYVAKYSNQAIAGVLVAEYGRVATYLHGGSSNEHRNLMAPYLLQWHAICQAKSRGCRYYDFWGVAPKDAPTSHPWAGVTRFKEGFGGQAVDYIGAYTFVFRPGVYFFYRRLRQIMRVIRLKS